MKAYTVLILTMFCGSALLAGPKVKSISADLEKASPGDIVTVTVTLKGNSKNVSSMELIVREFPMEVPPYILKPVDGKKNKVWTVSIPIPMEAPAGSYNLELKAKLKDGHQLETEGSTGNQHGRSGTLRMVVL